MLLNKQGKEKKPGGAPALNDSEPSTSILHTDTISNIKELADIAAINGYTSQGQMRRFQGFWIARHPSKKEFKNESVITDKKKPTRKTSI